ncbi:unnamed protein product [Phytophthora lilii]|uniref:Unnamed protein product n=1 Tax=Phytophthora lilii TaxID=2077276 RepID=A0A9W6TYD3_9STRA|nr:unnamed protein product [Phytophthora lilii]
MHLSSLLLACTAGLSGAAAKTTQPILFAGSYTRQEAWVNGTGKGIYTFKFNASDGSLTPFGVTQVGTNPMYVQGSTKTFSDGKPIPYAINSVGDNSTNQPGTQTGFVSALTLQSDGTLKTLNTLETQGAVPVHISLSPNENFVVVSNYANSVTMYPLKDDGSLSSKTFHQAFPIGSNVVASRQASGHPHSTMWLPHSNHVVVADLGSDELHQYELDQENQTLKSIGSVHSLPGSGPRHMAHHPNGRFAYVVGELTNSVSVYKIA